MELLRDEDRIQPMTKIYIAGQMNNAADLAQRKFEREQIEEALEFFGVRHLYEIFNPSESGVTFKDGAPTTDEIFALDYKQMDEAEILFFDISTTDTGTMVELGIVAEMYCRGGDPRKVIPKVIFPVIEDIQVENAHKFHGYEIPQGWNSFLIGTAKAVSHNSIIYSKFSIAIDSFKAYLSDKHERLF